MRSCDFKKLLEDPQGDDEAIASMPVMTPTLAAAIKRKRKRQQDFVMTTRAQFDQLATARHLATVKVFLCIQFLVFRSSSKSVRLANVALARAGIGRNGKRAALAELEGLGLIRVTRYAHRSPEIQILDLSEGGE